MGADIATSRELSHLTNIATTCGLTSGIGRVQVGPTRYGRLTFAPPRGNLTLSQRIAAPSRPCKGWLTVYPRFRRALGTVKRDSAAGRGGRIVSPRNGRPGLSTTAFAVIVIVVIVIGGVVGFSVPKGSKSTTTSVTSTTPRPVPPRPARPRSRASLRPRAPHPRPPSRRALPALTRPRPHLRRRPRSSISPSPAVRGRY